MERIGVGLLAVYALTLTFWHARSPHINTLCTRDFVDPAAQGSCLCGERQYCLCTPSMAADVIIELEDPHSDGIVREVVFIERKDGRGLAMVGGFVRVGESAEDAAVREALEETGLHVHSLQQWCLFSNPNRDPRRHTAAQVFVGRAKGEPSAHDDAKGIRKVSIAELQTNMPKFAFDHGDIVGSFVRRFHPPPGQIALSLEPRGRNRSLRIGRKQLDYDWACSQRVTANA